jgi:hypothetical protein
MMLRTWKPILKRQFGAALDMLENALAACPDSLWNVHLWEDPEMPHLAEFNYIAYHTLFWCDLYLSGAVEGFTPPAPFDLNELDPAGLLPAAAITRMDLRAYVKHCREKSGAVLSALTNESMQRRCNFPWGELSFAELLIDDMRHVQEHAAQLNMVLGQQKGLNSRWVAQEKTAL